MLNSPNAKHRNSTQYPPLTYNSPATIPCLSGPRAQQREEERDSLQWEEKGGVAAGEGAGGKAVGRGGGGMGADYG